MDDGAAILRAVLAAPADDFPRLAYADWLEENGQDRRAEHIRVQVAQASLVCHHPDAEGGGWLHRSYCDDTLCPHCALYHRAYDIEHDMDMTGRVDIDNERSQAFFGVPFPWSPDHSSDWDSWRGFLVRVCCPLQTWLDHGTALTAAHPLERIEVTDKQPSFEGGAWWWYLGDDTGPEDYLPHDVFRSLPGCSIAQVALWCDTQAQAEGALSAALLHLARTPQEVT